jgi:ribA/ribD-fused uncharacterized protein
MKPPVRGFTGPYAWLSNFHIEPDGSFVEYEYQRAKCADWDDRAKFDTLFEKGTLNPKQAKAIGRKVKIRDDWEDKKVEIMLFYVQKKFRDHEDLRILLQLTGDAHLEETNWWGDTYWGVCKGVGLNVLGDILMMVRSELPTL